jgi:HD-like signal output (HDOD) protein
MSTLWERVTRDTKLISLPEAYLKLKGVLRSPNYTVQEVAEAISYDPALTTRILRLVNSPYFGLANRIDNIPRAVSLLGTQQIHDLALATAVAHSFSGIDPNLHDVASFWRQSVFCGLVAQQLAKVCHMVQPERLFVAGLLSDLGHLILYQSIPKESLYADQLSLEQARPLVEVEREVLGLDYARVGATLMRQWQLPESLIESTEYHPEPMRALRDPLATATVHLANQMARARATGLPIDEGVMQPHPESLKRLGVTLAGCSEIGDLMEPEMNNLLHLLNPLGKVL